jgi:phage FluMu protein Com
MTTLHKRTTTMTGLVKRTQNKENEDDKFGPKIRHPSGHVFPNVIFLREKHGKTKLSSAARLYQDIIQYSLSEEYDKLKEEEQREGFKVTDIGNWLLDKNQDYFNHYKGSNSKIREKSKLESISKRIKRYLDNLERWGIIRKVRQVDADTYNGTKTWLYGYGRMGVIIAWILKYDHYKFDDDRKQKAKNIIFDLIQKMFKSYNAYKTDFTAEFYHKLIEYDSNNERSFCDSVLRQIISQLENQRGGQSRVIDYFDTPHELLRTLASDLQSKQTLLRLYLQTLDELPEDARRVVMYSEKFFFERNLLISQPSKKWSKTWIENISNYDTIILCGLCKNKECLYSSGFYTIECNYYNYISVKILSSGVNGYVEVDCPACKTQNSLHVYNNARFIGT